MSEKSEKSGKVTLVCMATVGKVTDMYLRTDALVLFHRRGPSLLSSFEIFRGANHFEMQLVVFAHETTIFRAQRHELGREKVAVRR